MVVFSENPVSWKIKMKPTTGNVVISEVDALAYAVLRRQNKKCHTGNELVPQNV
jgi:hypothetical protein